MFVQQFFVKGIAHSSYLLGGPKHCAIVDPRRDVEIYLRAAKDRGVKITHILETHLHADFISGHLDLAKKTGARIYAPKSAGCAFSHEPVAEGDTITIDDMVLRVLETPGHTPEHVSYVVTDTSRSDQPAGVFCGDTLFVGDVGRPDLFPNQAQELADKLYHSLHDKLMALPDHCEVYPAHGAGSLCGRAMAAKRTSTIGYERLANLALQIKDKQAFIRSLTTNMPPAPDHFSRCSAINGKGPALVSGLPGAKALPGKEFYQKSRSAEFTVIDTRAYDAFGGQHVPGAYHIDLYGNFATFAGWVIPPEKQLLLVVNKAEEAVTAVKWLRRVGLDNTAGYLEGNMLSWARQGLPVAQVSQLPVQVLQQRMDRADKPSLLDVRAANEFATGHLPGAINIPAPDLRTRFSELNKDRAYCLMCPSGFRSSLGVSLLMQQGYTRLYNLIGGTAAAKAAGMEMVT